MPAKTVPPRNKLLWRTTTNLQSIPIAVTDSDLTQIPFWWPYVCQPPCEHHYYMTASPPCLYLLNIVHSRSLLRPTASKAGIGFQHGSSYPTKADCIKKERQKLVSKRVSSMTAGVSAYVKIYREQCLHIYLYHKSLRTTMPHSSLTTLHSHLCKLNDVARSRGFCL